MSWTTRQKRFGGRAGIEAMRAHALPRLRAMAEMGVKQAAEEENFLLGHESRVPHAAWRRLLAVHAAAPRIVAVDV